MAKFTIITVVGMHRSGTSLVADTIHGFGVPMGQHLLAGDAHNKRGYFEDTEVIKIHNHLLSELDRSWGSVRHTFPLPQDWENSPAAKDASAQLQAYLATQIKQHDNRGCWAVKDPRLSLFLPLWKNVAQALGVELKVVYCLRHVESVAASLLERDNLPRAAARVLWLHYNAHIIQAAKTEKTELFWFDEWRTSSQDVIARLQAFCGIDPDVEITSPYSGTKYKRQPAKAKGVFGDWETAIIAALSSHRITKRLKDLAHNYLQFADTTRIWPQFVDDEAVRNRISMRLEKDLEVYRTAHDALSVEFTKAQAEAQDIRAALADVTAQRDQFRQERDEVVVKAASHLQAYRTVEVQLAETREVLKDTQANMTDALLARARAEGRLAEKTQAMEALQRLLQKTLDDVRAAQEAQLDQLRQDHAARIANLKATNADDITAALDALKRKQDRELAQKDQYFKSEIATLEAESAQAQADKLDFVAKVAALEARNAANITGLNQAHGRKRAEQEKRTAQTQAALDQAKSALEQTQTTLDHRQADLEQTQTALDHSQTKLDQTQSVLKQTQSAFNQAGAAHQEAAQSAKARHLDLHLKLKQTQEVADQNRDALQVAHTRLDESDAYTKQLQKWHLLSMMRRLGARLGFRSG